MPHLWVLVCIGIGLLVLSLEGKPKSFSRTSANQASTNNGASAWHVAGASVSGVNEVENDSLALMATNSNTASARASASSTVAISAGGNKLHILTSTLHEEAGNRPSNDAVDLEGASLSVPFDSSRLKRDAARGRGVYITPPDESLVQPIGPGELSELRDKLRVINDKYLDALLNSRPEDSCAKLIGISRSMVRDEEQCITLASELILGDANKSLDYQITDLLGRTIPARPQRGDREVAYDINTLGILIRAPWWLREAGRRIKNMADASRMIAAYTIAHARSLLRDKPTSRLNDDCKAMEQPGKTIANMQPSIDQMGNIANRNELIQFWIFVRYNIDAIKSAAKFCLRYGQLDCQRSDALSLSLDAATRMQNEIQVAFERRHEQIIHASSTPIFQTSSAATTTTNSPAGRSTWQFYTSVTEATSAKSSDGNDASRSKTGTPKQVDGEHQFSLLDQLYRNMGY